MSRLNIAYACNDGYIMQTGISLISLLENNRQYDEIYLYMISCGISKNNILLMESICNSYKRTMITVDFDDIAHDLNISAIGRHIKTIYAKIFFERIEGVDKMLYIDSDTIVAGKLDDMWNANLDGCYMGMVQTTTGADAKVKLDIPVEEPFFNDGMAMVNIKYCRENNLIHKCLNLIEQFDGNPPVLSEGCLNKVCQGHILKLSPRFNMMSGIYELLKYDVNYASTLLDYDKEDLIESFEHPVIIHYLAGFYNRPWSKYCTHPLRSVFYKYKAMSPWSNLPLTDTKLPFRLRIIGKINNIFGPKVTTIIQKVFKRVTSK